MIEGQRLLLDNSCYHDRCTGHNLDVAKDIQSIFDSYFSNNHVSVKKM